MSEFNGHYIGYGRLETWAEVASVLVPAYVCLVSESETSIHGLRNERAVVLCAQPAGALVHYCRIPVATIQWIGDAAFTQDLEQRIERAEQAHAIVLDWLQEHGFGIRDAAIAFPRDYKLMDGRADFLGYDKERGYYRKQEEAA